MRKAVLLLTSFAFVVSVSGEAFAQARTKSSEGTSAKSQGQAQPRKSPPPPPSKGSGGSTSTNKPPLRGSGQAQNPPSRRSPSTPVTQTQRAVPRPTTPSPVRPAYVPRHYQWHPHSTWGFYSTYDRRFYRPGCIWTNYGYWCDPYLYYYPPRRYYPPVYPSRDPTPEEEVVGSIRLIANVNYAKVYINGSYVGIVDDFDGLSNHLVLEPGYHQLELKAAGYQTVTKEILVVRGKTMTERISLQRN